MGSDKGMVMDPDQKDIFEILNLEIFDRYAVKNIFWVTGSHIIYFYIISYIYTCAFAFTFIEKLMFNCLKTPLMAKYTTS